MNSSQFGDKQVINRMKVSGCSTEQIKKADKVFHGLWKLKECYRMQLDPQAVLVARAPRKIPPFLRSKLKEDLDRLEKELLIV